MSRERMKSQVARIKGLAAQAESDLRDMPEETDWKHEYRQLSKAVWDFFGRTTATTGMFYTLGASDFQDILKTTPATRVHERQRPKS